MDGRWPRSNDACEAADLLPRLTIEEQWFLMEATRIRKKGDGWFNEKKMKAQSRLMLGLRALEADCEKVIGKLMLPRAADGSARPILVGGHHGGPWRKSREGSIVGHQLDCARTWATHERIITADQANSPSGLARIVEAVELQCGDNRQAAEQAGGPDAAVE